MPQDDIPPTVRRHLPRLPDEWEEAIDQMRDYEVDRTLLRANLMLTPEQRWRKIQQNLLNLAWLSRAKFVEDGTP